MDKIRYAWKAKVKPGHKEEYIKRHKEIWLEMVEELKKAGIKNYSIWIVDDVLFGYYECEKGIDYALKVQAESKIVDKWNEYMKDVLEMEMDPITKGQPHLEEIFYLE